MATNKELNDAIESIYAAESTADGSRLGMQDALDEIRQFCIEVRPDLDEDEDEDVDGDGISDDEQED